MRPIRFWATHLALPMAAILLLRLVYPHTGLDDTITRWYYDPGIHGFPLRSAPWLNAGLHSGLRIAVFALGGALLFGWLSSYADGALRPHRRQLGWIVACMMLASATVSLLKQGSVQHCPWDVAAYGGYAPHLALFDALPPGIAAGHCFPAGHASGGFALMAAYFGLRDSHPAAARRILAGALALGWIMGWGQTMRGAHFLSHTLWSAGIEWFVLLVAYLMFPPVPGPGRRASWPGR